MVDVVGLRLSEAETILVQHKLHWEIQYTKAPKSHFTNASILRIIRQKKLAENQLLLTVVAESH